MIPYQAKTLLWRLQQGHAENSNGDKVVLDAVWWMNGRSCKWFMSQMHTGVQETPEGMLGELGSLLGLGFKLFGWTMSPSATAGETFKQNLTFGTWVDCGKQISCRKWLRQCAVKMHCPLYWWRVCKRQGQRSTTVGLIRLLCHFTACMRISSDHLRGLKKKLLPRHWPYSWLTFSIDTSSKKGLFRFRVPNI